MWIVNALNNYNHAVLDIHDIMFVQCLAQGVCIK